MKRIIAFTLILLMLIPICVSCGNEPENTTEASSTSYVEETPVIQYAKFTFKNFGSVKIELYGDKAPITVSHFVELIESGYYDGTSIIRCQKGFVLQGGTGKGTSSIKGEFSANGVYNPIKHTKGVLSMARSQNMNSASDQFFIVLDDAAQPSLDGNYAAFGKIVEGWDVIEKIVSSFQQSDFVDDIYYGYFMGFLKESGYITISSAVMVK